MGGMANTYTQIYIQIVFAVEGRQNLIQPKHNDELQKYITGIVSGSASSRLITTNDMFLSRCEERADAAPGRGLGADGGGAVTTNMSPPYGAADGAVPVLS